MPIEARVALAFAAGAAVTAAATPLAIRLARLTDFYDHPADHKAHSVATPYLGGAAVVAGFLVAALALGDGAGEWLAVVLGAGALWIVGTIDDRLGLGAWPRVAAAALVAAGMYAAGVGWSVTGSDAADLAMSVVWVVALVNAFNLFDNLDGATATVGAVAAAGAGLLAGLEGDGALAGLAFALAGACAGFLPFNLTRPRARIFLGDGGSMAIGAVVAVLTMSLTADAGGGTAPLLVGVLLTGMAILDTTLVMVSRLRRGVSILTGGRDHLTHRLLRRLHTERRVAAAVGLAQAALAAAAVAAAEAGRVEVAAVAVAYGILAAGALVAFELRLPAGGSASSRALPSQE